MTRDEWRYFLKAEIYFGNGSLERLTSILQKIGQKKGILVCGRGAMRKAGILSRVERLAKEAGKGFVVFEEAEPNPKIETCEKGLALAKKEGCDFVIGLGGGSALDAAKAISALMANEINIEKTISENIPLKNEAAFTIAIPTTSGTATEINKFSVLTSSRGRKMAMRDEKIVPKIALIDPLLTLSCPPRVTAASGLDAIAHAVESYWSTKSNPVSRIFCIEAIKLANSNLEKAVKNGKDLKARENMALASLYAGLGFSNTGTTDVHKISYPVTERLGLEHGFACALFLPEFIEFNIKGNEITLKEIANAFGKKDAKKAAARLRQIMKNVGAPLKLKDLGAAKEDLEFIIKEGYSNNKRNNPRKIKISDLRKIVSTIA